MGKFITHNDLVFLLRIILAMLAGAVIGYEREKNVKVAGFRTHILIAMASAIMMIVSKYAFIDILADPPAAGLEVDISRVAAGIIAGMGIFSGGIVFIGKRGNVSGLTTAAGIWATIGIGMVIGAGMYVIGISSVIMVELVQLLFNRDLSVYRHAIVATITFDLKDRDADYDKIAGKLKAYNARMNSQKWEKTGEKGSTLNCSVIFDKKYDRDEIVDILNGIEEARAFDIP